jgi:hypothetical protein
LHRIRSRRKKEQTTPRPEKKDQQPAQPRGVIITINGKPVPARIQVVPVKPVPAPQPNPPEKKDQQPGKKDGKESEPIQPAQPGDVIITINGKPVPARIQVVPVKPVPAPQPNPPEKKDQQPGKKDGKESEPIQPAQPGDVIITINGKPVPARIQVVPVKPVPAPQPNPPEKKDQQPGKKD